LTRPAANPKFAVSWRKSESEFRIQSHPNIY
jgi:hypothetical protein